MATDSPPKDSGGTFPGLFRDLLSDKVNFPSFKDLPEETIADKRYWKVVNGTYQPKCTWFFLGEITDTTNAYLPGPMFRNRVLVSDRTGKQSIPILFYPQSGRFDFKQLKKGCTICILLAEKHHFLDFTTGIRVENLDTVKVIQCGLNDLLSLSKTYAQRKDSNCWHCGKGPPKSQTDRHDGVRNDSSNAAGVTTKNRRMKMCASCKVARYCDKSCQATDWRKCHRRWCKVLPDFLALTKTDLSKYDKDYWFTLIPCDENESFEMFLQTLLNL